MQLAETLSLDAYCPYLEKQENIKSFLTKIKVLRSYSSALIVIEYDSKWSTRNQRMQEKAS